MFDDDSINLKMKDLGLQGHWLTALWLISKVSGKMNVCSALIKKILFINFILEELQTYKKVITVVQRTPRL